MQTLPNEIAAYVLSFLPCKDLAVLIDIPTLDPVVQCIAHERRGLYAKSTHLKSDPVMAARAGHWQCLCAMRSDSVCDDAVLCAGVASSGNLGMLQCAHKESWTWDASTTYEAARGGHVDCLRYAVENGCPLKRGLLTAVERLCASTRGGHRECDARTACTTAPCSYPAKCRLFDVFVYLMDVGGQWGCLSSQCLAEAAANGRVDVLIIAHPMRLCGEDGIAGSAARHGHVACLVYLHSAGYPWGGYECGEAMRGHHLDCLAYLHENGCPWHQRDREIAVRCGDKACYDYAKAHGCFPADAYVGQFARLFGGVGDLRSFFFSS